MSNLPVSALIRQGGLGTEDGIESGKRKSKDEYKRQKDLEEQRKAGTAPAMVDVETGRDINPHIPEFIEKAPWYIPHSGPTLKHQRPQPERQKVLGTIADWYPKGTTDRVAFKYRDGACENCGAMGHTKKTCFEKPRLVGAKWSNSNIAPDDNLLPKLDMAWDAKRDRWNGYNPDDYKFVVEEFDKMDETRRLIRAEHLKETGEEESKLDEDEDIYAEDASAPGQSIDMDSRTRITVRNLRIREDTARYLYNLDPDSPYYDPKSRSMRENPLKNVPGKEQEAAQFAGENFMRFTGEVSDANEAQVFAWQARCKGIDVHSLAEPTRLEALKKEFEKQKTETKSSVQNELLEKYGGEEHMSAPPKELLLAQTENYVEYNRKGRVIRGEERAAAKSRYVEDNYPNNHTAVWGSYWRDGRWGFACCHQHLRNCYCIGEEGIKAEQAEIGPGRSLIAMPGAMALEKTKTVSTSITVEAAPSDEMQNAMKQQMMSAAKQQEVESDGEEQPDMEEAKKKGKTANPAVSDEVSSADDDANQSGNESEEEMDVEDQKRYEEQLELERQKKEREDKRREQRREKRRRKKEKAAAKRAENGGGDKKSKNGKGKKMKHSSASSSSSSASAAESDESDTSGSSDNPAMKKKYSKELRRAIKKQLEQRAEGREMAEQGDRKRKFHRGLDAQADEQKPSAVDQEAYNLTRIHSADPMAQFFEAKEQKRMTAKRAKGGDDD